MTKKKTDEVEQQDAPSLLLDAYGNPNLVSAGELIESAWGNSVAQRVVQRFPTQAAMTAVSAPSGTLAVTTDLGIVWLRQGTVWKPTTIGNKVTFRVNGGAPGQNVVKNTITLCTWAAVLYDPFAVLSGGGLFTCPAGWGGRWVFDWSVQFDVASITGQRLAFLSTNDGSRYAEHNVPAMEGGTRMSGSASILMNPGNSVGLYVYHTDTSASLLCNTTNQQFIQGYYAGPY